MSLSKAQKKLPPGERTRHPVVGVIFNQFTDLLFKRARDRRAAWRAGARPTNPDTFEQDVGWSGEKFGKRYNGADLRQLRGERGIGCPHNKALRRAWEQAKRARPA